MARSLRDGVWWLDLTGVNAYLVDDDGDLVLVDTGMPWDVPSIRAGIRDAGFAPSDVDRVLVTHYDPDHVGGLRRLDLDCPIFIGAGDAPYLQGQLTPDWTKWKGLLQRVLYPFFQPRSLDVRPVTDGDTVGSFIVYETPGHTEGHVAYVSADYDVAFLGDLVQARSGELATPPWLLSANMRAVQESIRSLVENAPAFDLACPGHGNPLLGGGRDALVRTLE